MVQRVSNHDHAARLMATRAATRLNGLAVDLATARRGGWQVVLKLERQTDGEDVLVGISVRKEEFPDGDA